MVKCRRCKDWFFHYFRGPHFLRQLSYTIYVSTKRITHILRAHASEHFQFCEFFNCFGCHIASLIELSNLVANSFYPLENPFSFFNIRSIWRHKHWASEAQNSPFPKASVLRCNACNITLPPQYSFVTQKKNSVSKNFLICYLKRYLMFIICSFINSNIKNIWRS